jgi:ERCC4-type nuclease
MVGKGKKVKSVKHKKVKSSANPLYDIYLSLPGVGDKRAQKLLEAYPKLSDLITDYKNNALKIKLPKVTLEALNFL